VALLAMPTPAQAMTFPMQVKSTRMGPTLLRAAGRGRRYVQHAVEFVWLMEPACTTWARLFLLWQARRLAQI
jgi:hypothetical protein